MTCTCSIPSDTAHTVCRSTVVWVDASEIGHRQQIFNGLCECRGPLGRHPFHTVRPLPLDEYVGKHRAD